MSMMSLGPLQFLRFKRPAARSHLETLTAHSLRYVAQYLNLEHRWVMCNLMIPENRSDLISLILRMAHRPCSLLHNALLRKGTQKSLTSPNLKATCMRKHRGYWLIDGDRLALDASTLLKRHFFAKTLLQSVIHLAQPEFGTGVNISPTGVILTCSHVITHADDGDSYDFISIDRLGRRKVIIWPSGQTSVVECVYQKEIESGKLDLAICVVVEFEEDGEDESEREVENDVIDVDDGESQGRCRSCSHWKRRVDFRTRYSFPASRVWNDEPAPDSEPRDPEPIRGDELVCVGCPSHVNLNTGESHGLLRDCEPPVWHVSLGTFVGLGSKPGFGALMHSCWTYWGHSGAPLFHAKSRGGAVVGIHTAWDSDTGTRHGIDYRRIRKFVNDWERETGGDTGVLPSCCCCWRNQSVAGVNEDGEPHDDVIVIDED